VVGPRASTAAFRPAVAVDTGLPGVHEAGMALRMDDVPLPLRAFVTGFPNTADVAHALGRQVATS
jgi:formylmethanofuran dehydrogenase subunit B